MDLSLLLYPFVAGSPLHKEEKKSEGGEGGAAGAPGRRLGPHSSFPGDAAGGAQAKATKQVH
jgi:hypothetical protein